ncbi:uncharacterized protein (TIGR01244 family) [Litorimonas taeanensis]|uniref:Uncharacterized protein (TIGR01244 family) n=1 Tax=Litorimonas taeanensis TaxID=568099 RepID=A0A420WK12_9PROT|nr:sulfur transferase domain-containing protein [Litorimonas taeanensis]RKQ71350.1 uncharacterized protein (TIGR01244 family) [Litorimonas taeanensis]
MHELPGKVFVTGQLLPEQLIDLHEKGVQSLINNRPEREALNQPTSDEIESAALAIDMPYNFIPMAGGLSLEIIEASVEAYGEMPRPIVAYCASGMRSAALWGFAHVKSMGADSVIEALNNSPYNLEQIYPSLRAFSQDEGGA